MSRTTTRLAALSLLTLATAAAGCSASANGKPYQLTGNADTPATRDAMRWTDNRGMYHPEWRNGINTPAGYPRTYANAQ